MAKLNVRKTGFIVLGVVFLKLALLAQGQTVEVIHSFDLSGAGSVPKGGLLQGSDGMFYGTTSIGGRDEAGNFGSGSVFKMTTSGSLTTLLIFSRYTTGDSPRSALVEGKDGNFYGTTYDGGTNLNGTIFKMTPQGSRTILNGSASRPSGPLLQGADGFLYGTSDGGGTNGDGAVFKMTTNGAFTTLVSFSYYLGVRPYGGVIQATNGNFYGTTVYGGGSLNVGTIFKMTPAGVLTTLVLFNRTNGANPFGGLLQASDGNIYGTTSLGGTSNYGTVFRLTMAGEFTTLLSFNRTNGANPYAKLIEASDGYLYGTTSSGGTNGGFGTLFKMSREGVLTSLFSFSKTNGSSPASGVIQASDGNLYGTTEYGGPGQPHGNGTIFRYLMPRFALNSQVSGNKLVLSWPTNALGFTLQSAADLNSSWTNVTASPPIVGSQFVLTNTITGNGKFYRLKK